MEKTVVRLYQCLDVTGLFSPFKGNLNSGDEETLPAIWGDVGNALAAKRKWLRFDVVRWPPGFVACWIAFISSCIRAGNIVVVVADGHKPNANIANFFFCYHVIFIRQVTAHQFLCIAFKAAASLTDVFIILVVQVVHCLRFAHQYECCAKPVSPAALWTRLWQAGFGRKVEINFSH